jgi:hypothetical protein
MAFGPNDFVQQEERRTLLSLTQEGRPLLQLEHFNAENATSLVWVNPQRLNDSDDEQRFARESALAARWYTRAGSADWHLFGRLGQHTGASAGAALAWVATDALELHASLRVLQRHDGWRIDPLAADAPVTSNPWQVGTLGGASQWLVGANWTGAAQQSVIVEWWHDGTALSDADWDTGPHATPRSRACCQPNCRRLCCAASPATWPGKPRRSQPQPAPRQPLRAPRLAARTLVVHARCADHSSRSRPCRHRRLAVARRPGALNAAWRVYGGPSNSLVARLPQRRSGVLAATWAF